MAIHRYECKKCGKIITLFSYEEAKCECGSNELQKCYDNPPLKNKNVNKVDWYRGTMAPEGIEQDLRKRSREATYETLDEMIQEYGRQIALEQGWISKKTGKKVTKEEFMLLPKTKK